MPPLLSELFGLTEPGADHQQFLQNVRLIGQRGDEYGFFLQHSCDEYEQRAAHFAATEERLRTILAVFPQAILWPSRIVNDVLSLIGGESNKKGWLRQLAQLRDELRLFSTLEERLLAMNPRCSELLQEEALPEGDKRYIEEARAVNERLYPTAAKIRGLLTGYYVLAESCIGMLFPEERKVNMPYNL